MKVLARIFEQHANEEAALDTKLTRRQSARVVLLDKSGRVAVVHSSAKDFYLLPGGGVDQGETPEGAALREVREETGFKCVIAQELGMTLEYMVEKDILNESFGYIAETVGAASDTELMDYEEGYEVIWAKSIEEAIDLIDTQIAASYEGRFSRAKELAILSEAKVVMASNS